MKKTVLLIATAFCFFSATTASAQQFVHRSTDDIRFQAPEHLVFVPTRREGDEAVTTCRSSVGYLAENQQLLAYVGCLKQYVEHGFGRLFDLRQSADVAAYNVFLLPVTQGTSHLEPVHRGQ